MFSLCLRAGAFGRLGTGAVWLGAEDGDATDLAGGAWGLSFGLSWGFSWSAPGEWATPTRRTSPSLAASQSDLALMAFFIIHHQPFDMGPRLPNGSSNSDSEVTSSGADPLAEGRCCGV
jgi:hypothetical protein